MLLYIIRHGEPIYEPDILTERGHLQAQALAERLAVHGLHRIYSSPQGRARQTAMPTAEKLGLPITTLPWTREIWPELALPQPDGSLKFVMGLPGALYRSEENRTLGDNWHTMDCFAPIKAKESYEMVARESDAFLETLGYRREGGAYRILRASEERVAVFCHAGLTLTWLPHLLAIPPHLFWAAFDIGHTGVTILHFANEENGVTTPRCLSLSDLSHIYRTELPFAYNSALDL